MSWAEAKQSMRNDIGKGGAEFLRKYYGSLIWADWCTSYQWVKQSTDDNDDMWGKTDNCGIAALNAQQKGMLDNPLKNPNAVKEGDRITYCYSNDMSECTPGYRSHEHIERVTKVYRDSNGNVTGVDSIGGNTGSNDCTTSIVKEHYWDKSYFAGFLHNPYSQGNTKHELKCYFKIVGWYKNKFVWSRAYKAGEKASLGKGVHIIGFMVWLELDGVYNKDYCWYQSYHNGTMTGLAKDGTGSKIKGADRSKYQWSGCGDGKYPINVPITMVNMECLTPEEYATQSGYMKLIYAVRPCCQEWSKTVDETNWVGTKDVAIDGLYIDMVKA